MVVIFFNLGLVLAFILLVSIVFINASTKFVLAILAISRANDIITIRTLFLYLYNAKYKSWIISLIKIKYKSLPE